MGMEVLRGMLNLGSRAKAPSLLGLARGLTTFTSLMGEPR